MAHERKLPQCGTIEPPAGGGVFRDASEPKTIIQIRYGHILWGGQELPGECPDVFSPTPVHQMLEHGRLDRPPGPRCPPPTPWYRLAQRVP